MSPWNQKPDGNFQIVGPQKANHHWWPRGLSKYWVGDDGFVGCVRINGTNINTIRTKHMKLGGIKDAHSLIFGKDRHDSPWNRSEEHVFNDADSSMGLLVKHLESMVIQARDVQDKVWHPVPDDKELSYALAPAMLSLCLRNPHSRYLASSMGREIMGYELGSQVDKNVSLRNVLSSYRAHLKPVRSRGRFGIFVAREGEFIYGDGCFHNVRLSGDFFGNISMLVPMTPKIAVGYRLPNRYMTNPMFCVMNIGAEIVNTFNELVQVYSGKQLFFSKIQPKISPYFKCGEFSRVESQSNPALYWLNQLPGL